MSVFGLFRRQSSAPVARERLQILLAHERGGRGQSDLLAILREEILAVIEKHVSIERDNVQIKMDRGDKVSLLEIDIEIPNSVGLLDRRSGLHRARIEHLLGRYGALIEEVRRKDRLRPLEVGIPGNHNALAVRRHGEERPLRGHHLAGQHGARMLEE